MQPLWAQLDALMTVLTIPRLGAERADRQYRMRSLDESGAPLAFGSDWPVSSGAPLDGIAVAVSRRTADGRPEGGWTPEEILTIERALIAYTAGVAEQAFAEGHWGTIAPGASADLVWLDRDPRSTPPLELPGIARAGHLSAGQAGLFGRELKENAMSSTAPADPTAAYPASEAGEGHLRRALGVPSLVLFGLVYMVPLTVFTTYGIVTETHRRPAVGGLPGHAGRDGVHRAVVRADGGRLPGGRFDVHLHAEDLRGTDRLPGRLVAAAGLPVPADAELPRHRHLPERRDSRRCRLGSSSSSRSPS